MRVRVLKLGAVPQAPALSERGLDDRIRLEDLEAADDAGVAREPAIHADRGVDVEAVPHAGIEVVRAVAWCGMHRARPLLERDVFSEDAERIAVVEGVSELDPFQLRARNARDLLPERPAGGRRHGFREGFGEDDHPVSVRAAFAVRFSGQATS